MSAILSNRRVILLAVVVAVLSLVLSLVITRPKQKEESPMATEIFGVKIEKNPPESRLVELGVRTWRTYVSLKTTFTFCLFTAFSLFLLLKFVGFLSPECVANIVLKNLGSMSLLGEYTIKSIFFAQFFSTDGDLA
jgi:hypothetical protein